MVFQTGSLQDRGLEQAHSRVAWRAQSGGVVAVELCEHKRPGLVRGCDCGNDNRQREGRRAVPEDRQGVHVAQDARRQDVDERVQRERDCRQHEQEHWRQLVLFKGSGTHACPLPT